MDEHSDNQNAVEGVGEQLIIVELHMTEAEANTAKEII